MPLSATPHPARDFLSRSMLDTLFETELRIRRASEMHLGYPYNLTFVPRVPPGLGTYLINNLGDPYVGSHYGSEVCALEREAIAWLSQLWGGADMDLYTGSIGASGTEGNIWGIHLGREALPDAALVHGADAHYSIPKAARIQRIDNFVVRGTPAGEMDLGDLARVLSDLKDCRPVQTIRRAGIPTTRIRRRS